MATIKVSPDKMAKVSAMCTSLVGRYDDDMNKTHEIMQLLGEMWDDPGIEGYKKELNNSLSEIEKIKTILMELRDCLTLAEDTMRQADQQLPSQLRDILF